LERELHIVCLDCPWPPDYGGAIDMMNRLVMFSKLGIGVHLHYFSYNERGNPTELNQFCRTVNVYERKTGSKGITRGLPYIVASRINAALVTALNKDNHPILLEGLHCTGILPHLDIPSRKILVRMHNEESTYYRELARAETSWLKRLYFRRESRLIRKYSAQLPKEIIYACVSWSDIQLLKEKYQLPQSVFIPTFPAWQQVTAEEGMGSLCLYHGNLSVPENEEAATWLLRNVFTRIRKPFVIAGKQPSRRLQKLAALCQHTCLVANPTTTEINDLVKKAHINVLPCFNRQETGIRLKLLHALFEGKHCIVHEAMVKGTGLEGACHIGTNAASFASIIAQLYVQPFTENEISLRKRLLGDTYDNEKNTRRLIQYLW
jgi:hypothetical protein